jgi:hypothetical protein
LSDSIKFPTLSPTRVRKTAYEGVWRVAQPRFWAWRGAGSVGATNRHKLTGSLAASFPIRALWLSELSDKFSGWHAILPGQDLAMFAGDMEEGHWLLAFFEHETQALAAFECDPAIPDEAAAISTLRRLGAVAAIWSWPDDLEWTVAIAHDHELREGPNYRFVDYIRALSFATIEIGLLFLAFHFLLTGLHYATAEWFGWSMTRYFNGLLYAGYFGASVGFVGGRYFRRLDAYSMARA